jgi:hypothetical protein
MSEQEEPLYYDDKYLYDNFWYYRTFPLEWAQSHLDETGPNYCENCADYGCVSGVFIGYCANCAIYVYEGARGRGFMGDGEEFTDPPALDYPSAFDTYLEGINIDGITPIPGSEQNIIYPDHNVINNIVQSDENQLNYNSYADEGISILNPQFEGGYNDW